MHPFASRTVVTAITLFVAIAAFGQNHPAKERGFKPEFVYDLNGFDTINTVNGNLSAAIPLGDAYPVGEGLSYSFVLRYTGNMWDEYEDPICVDPEPDGSCELLWTARGGDN
ncbi:MAG TPA: hypothetical protein VGQ76_00125, partial [Thermoanaerobaculia bacterium]|nr:hypothetical protein [Thermoanaerobaculia bacterium]